MRRIHVEDGLSVRFPGRSEEFNEGVEIGMLAVLMSSGQRGFTRWLSPANLEQARAIADRMGYRLTAMYRGARYRRSCRGHVSMHLVPLGLCGADVRA